MSAPEFLLEDDASTVSTSIGASVDPLAGTLRLLVIDDASADAARIAGALEEAGVSVAMSRVRSRVDLQAAADRGPYDLVASDWSDPELTALAAEALLRQQQARHAAERAHQAAEEQLRHAQKMESVGRIAAGIAHDFNNILTVILNHAECILETMDPGEPLRDDVAEIRTAVQGAAGLSRQLLALSRRDATEPRLFDPADVITRLSPMLRRVLGDAIQLVCAPANGLGRVCADEGHLEQVLLNLALNAKDAMPRGGRLLIEAGLVDVDEAFGRQRLGMRAGPTVVIAVTDTGLGMDRATRARIFEPYFTTKGAARGTGLGLSTSLGIVQKYGGTITVDSEPGIGASFKVYLPLADTQLGRARSGP